MKKNILKSVLTLVLISGIFTFISCGNYLNSLVYSDAGTTEVEDTSKTTFLVNDKEPSYYNLENWKICYFEKASDSYSFSKTLTPGTYYIYLCDDTYNSYYNSALTSDKVSVKITVSNISNTFYGSMSNTDYKYFTVDATGTYTIQVEETANSYSTKGYCAFYVYRTEDLI